MLGGGRWKADAGVLSDDLCGRKLKVERFKSYSGYIYITVLLALSDLSDTS
jgi:hypothetical protein